MYIWGAPELLPVASVAHVVAVALPWACSPVWFYLLGSSIFPLRMNRSSISRFNLMAFSWAQLPNSTFLWREAHALAGAVALLSAPLWRECAWSRFYCRFLRCFWSSLRRA